MLGALYLAATVLLTVYGQVAYKWIADDADPFPSETGERVSYLARLIFEPRMISVGLATALAAITYFLALRKLDLSVAYPFMSLSFVLVLLLSGVLFGEAVTSWKVIGVALIVGGTFLGTKV